MASPAVSPLAASTSDTLLLIARILVGWIFVRSGLGKLMDINAFIATMPGRGLPGWLGYVAAPVEFFGGIALILGIATRYVVLVMIIFMLVATFSSHRYWEFTDVAVRRAIAHCIDRPKIVKLALEGAGVPMNGAVSPIYKDFVKSKIEYPAFSIDAAKKAGDTLGGVVEVLAYGLPPGLGSHVH